MKYNLLQPSGIPYLFLLIFSFISPFASGQIISDDSWIQNIDWTVYGGLSFSLPVGESTKNIRSNYKAWENQPDETNQFKGQLSARPGAHRYPGKDL